VEGLQIKHFSSNGVEVAGTGNTVIANIIGSNGGNGVQIDHGGSGTAVLADNIGGNGGYGVSIADSNNSIGQGSFSVRDTSATDDIVYSISESSIHDNRKGGVLVSSGSGNTLFNPNSLPSPEPIAQLSIYSNGSTGSGPGISLRGGANDNLVAPIIESVSTSWGYNYTIQGTFVAPKANVSYGLLFYINPSGDPEGYISLYSEEVTPTSTGSQSFSFNFNPVEPFGLTPTVLMNNPLITAVLTDAGGYSTFSNGILTSGIPEWVVPNQQPINQLPPTTTQTNLPANVELLFLAEDQLAFSVDSIMSRISNDPQLTQRADQLMILLNNLLGLDNPALGNGLVGLQSGITANALNGSSWGIVAEAIGLDFAINLFGS
jgi:hypothetical protein